MRQHLREAVKWVFTGHLVGYTGVREKWHMEAPSTISSYCRRYVPYFYGHVPQESRTKAGGSLSKKWPKRPRHANKTYHWRQLRLIILYWWSFWVNEVHKRIRWRGLPKVSLSGKVLKTRASATILSWVYTATCKIDLLLNT